MLNVRNKKDLILEYRRARGLERVGPREIRAVETALRRAYGPEDRTSASYIANVLREAGAEVHFKASWSFAISPAPKPRCASSTRFIANTANSPTAWGRAWSASWR
ncbi:MAG: hypothetical protein DMG21_12340 [Acidobacteria bacterium]|nr:MAG: hypothetical protein DMG21_12340 [Acidobacteriota bacterium]